MDLARKTPLHQPAKATHPHRYNTSALFAQCFIVDCHYQSKRMCSTLQRQAIPNLLWYWPKSTTERTVQMYCSDVGGWLWRADATESYMQGPRTGKRCKLKVQNFCCCSVYWNMLYTRRVTYSWFPHFPISSNINLQQNGAKMYPNCDVMFNWARPNIPSLYVKRYISILVT